jgi:hypothetical protein
MAALIKIKALGIRRWEKELGGRAGTGGGGMMNTFLDIIGALALISIALVTLAIIGNSLPIPPP